MAAAKSSSTLTEYPPCDCCPSSGPQITVVKEAIFNNIQQNFPAEITLHTCLREFATILSDWQRMTLIIIIFKNYQKSTFYYLMKLDRYFTSISIFTW